MVESSRSLKQIHMLWFNSEHRSLPTHLSWRCTLTAFMRLYNCQSVRIRSFLPQCSVRCSPSVRVSDLSYNFREIPLSGCTPTSNSHTLSPDRPTIYSPTAAPRCCSAGRIGFKFWIVLIYNRPYRVYGGSSVNLATANNCKARPSANFILP
jgi:hypothetical protein